MGADQRAVVLDQPLDPRDGNEPTEGGDPGEDEGREEHAGSAEKQAFPVFKRNYELICERVINGEDLSIELPKAIPESINTPLSNDERKQRMQALRQELKL